MIENCRRALLATSRFWIPNRTSTCSMQEFRRKVSWYHKIGPLNWALLHEWNQVCPRSLTCSFRCIRCKYCAAHRCRYQFSRLTDYTFSFNHVKTSLIVKKLLALLRIESGARTAVIAFYYKMQCRFLNFLICRGNSTVFKRSELSLLKIAIFYTDLKIMKTTNKCIKKSRLLVTPRRRWDCGIFAAFAWIDIDQMKLNRIAAEPFVLVKRNREASNTHLRHPIFRSTNGAYRSGN